MINFTQLSFFVFFFFLLETMALITHPSPGCQIHGWEEGKDRRLCYMTLACVKLTKK